MRALAKIQASVERDAARSHNRGAGGCSLHAGQLDSDDEDEDVENVNKKLTRGIQKLISARQFCGTGVRLQHTQLAKVTAVQKFKAAKTKDHQAFVAGVLTSSALMLKSSEVMQSFHGPIFGSEGTVCGAELMNLVAKQMHKMKVLTAHTCWFDCVSKLKQESSDIGIRYVSLQNQFHDARRTYLQEITSLRDQVRFRVDPCEDNSDVQDIKYIHDPTSLLKPEELRFALDVVMEKIKMIFENTSRNSFDFSQLENLASRVGGNELDTCRAALQSKTFEVAELKQSLQIAVARGSDKFGSPKNGGGNGGGGGGGKGDDGGKGDVSGKGEMGGGEDLPSTSKDRLVSALESDLDAVRTELWEQRSNVQTDKLQIQNLELEREELVARVADEHSQRLALQDGLEQAQFESKAQQDELREAGRNAAKQQGLLKEGQLRVQELEGLLATLKEVQGAQDKPQERTPRTPRRKFGEGDENPFDKLQAWTMAETDIPEDQDSLEHLRTAAVDACERVNEYRQRNSELEARVSELEEVLRRHIDQLSTRRNQEDLEEAENLGAFAECLGCEPAEADSGMVTSCPCGNLLMPDAAFCRRCGQPARGMPKRKAMNDERRLLELATKLGDVNTQLEFAVATLDKELKTPKEDLDRFQRVANAENEVARLRREKAQLEAKILCARALEAGAASEAVLQDDGEDGACACSCAAEVEVLRAMVDKLKSLVTEMSGKLQAAVAQNAHLGGILLDAQGKLETAEASMLSSTDPKIKASAAILGGVRRECVFGHLRKDGERQQSKRDKQCGDLLNASCAILALSHEKGGAEDQHDTKGRTLEVSGTQLDVKQLPELRVAPTSARQQGESRKGGWTRIDGRGEVTFLPPGSELVGSRASDSRSQGVPPNSPRQAEQRTAARNTSSRTPRPRPVEGLPEISRPKSQQLAGNLQAPGNLGAPQARQGRGPGLAIIGKTV